MQDKLTSVKRDGLDVLLDSQIHDICDESSAFLSQMKCLATIDETSILEVGESGIKQLSSLAQSLSTHAIEICTRIADEQQRLASQRAALQQEQKTLESGIFQFPKDALDLKAAIVSRLRTLAKQDVTLMANAWILFLFAEVPFTCKILQRQISVFPRMYDVFCQLRIKPTILITSESIEKLMILLSITEDNTAQQNACFSKLLQTHL